MSSRCACLPDVYKRQEGTTLLFDIGWDDEMSLEKYRDDLRLADYFTPNTREALQITGTDTPEEAIRVLAGYMEHPLVKLDKDGCLILVDGQPRTVPNLSLIHISIPRAARRS